MSVFFHFHPLGLGENSEKISLSEILSYNRGKDFAGEDLPSETYFYDFSFHN